ncbi:unnamed protein product [Bursaphelenchus xylophilus]|uniref:(pine wood nematode) hypothetical protein n=1 Tax=Bursaphelenchus xylophilus TaxID=6326 RepID=A0A1I7RNL6_BURXY|nr:unnamed protein product [Bursaphelenchus xylophilus]CAG9124144.1 unnamed protein product [Bursaphelenchus xylophilus]
MLEGYLDVEDQFSKRWLLQILEGKCPKYQKLAGVKTLLNITSEILSEDNGYMSRIYLVKLIYEYESLEYCLKVPTWHKISGIFDSEREKSEENGEVLKLKAFHNNECNFYRLFGEHNVDGFKITHVYSFKHIDEDVSICPHILMDYFHNSGSVQIHESLNQKQLETLADQLAIMHGYLIGNGIYVDAKQFKPFDYKHELPKEEREKLGQLIQMKIEESGDQILVSSYKKAKPVIDTQRLFEHCIKQAHLELGIKPILCHGDLWANNALFELDGQRRATDNLLAIIDFQLANVGNPAQDLARILTINCDVAVRKANEESIYEYYYTKLSSYLKKHGKRPPFTLEQLILASKSQFIVQSLFCLFFLAFHFSAPEKQQFRRIFGERARYILDDCYTIAHSHFAHLLSQ